MEKTASHILFSFLFAIIPCSCFTSGYDSQWKQEEFRPVFGQKSSKGLLTR